MLTAAEIEEWEEGFLMDATPTSIQENYRALAERAAKAEQQRDELLRALATVQRLFTVKRYKLAHDIAGDTIAKIKGEENAKG